ncbi:MAG: hypothetical protein P8Y18_07975 [Candidatus Bathyarchaeota archaeon]
MTKRFKLVLFSINVLLGLVFLFASYNLWETLNNWYDWNFQSSWTPFYVYPHRISNMPTVLMPVMPILNLPFIIFCVTTIANGIILATYFLVNRNHKKTQ